MTIQLTQDEARVLLSLINLAVQAKGLEAAEVGVHFQKKIAAAAKDEEPPSYNVVDLPHAKEA